MTTTNNKPSQPKQWASQPESFWARILLVLGCVALGFAYWMHIPFWQVQLGLRPVGAGGGESLVVLLLGIPAVGAGAISFGVVYVRPAWRCKASLVGLCLCAVPILSWIIASL